MLVLSDRNIFTEWVYESAWGVPAKSHPSFVAVLAYETEMKRLGADDGEGYIVDKVDVYGDNWVVVHKEPEIRH